MTALVTHMGKATPVTREIVSALYDTWSQYLAAGVQALKDSGEIDASIDVDATATAVLAAIQGGVLMMQATDRISYLETALEEALDAMRRSGAPSALRRRTWNSSWRATARPTPSCS